MTILISLREAILILLEQVPDLTCLDFLKSSLNVDLIIHEQLHLIGIVHLIKAA